MIQTHPEIYDDIATAPHNDFKSDKYTFSGGVQSASGEDGGRRYKEQLDKIHCVVSI